MYRTTTSMVFLHHSSCALFSAPAVLFLLISPIACTAGDLALSHCNDTKTSQLFKWVAHNNQIVTASDVTKCWDGDGGGVCT